VNSSIMRDEETSLHVAAEYGHIDIVQLLLDRGALIDGVDSSGWAALHTGAIKGHLDIVRLLLDRGAQIDAKDNMGATALLLAINKRHVEIVRLLLDRGAGKEIADSKGRTPLFMAALDNSSSVTKRIFKLEIVQLLLQYGTLLNAKSQRTGETTLHAAAFTRDGNLVEFLIDNGATIDVGFRYSANALVIAIDKGRRDIAQLLLDKGAAISIGNHTIKSNGKMLLEIAAQKDNLDIDMAKFLLDRRASIDTDRAVLLLEDAVYKCKIDIRRFLLEIGIDIDVNISQPFLKRYKNGRMLYTLQLLPADVSR
jgi:ankyrin repeat protein